MVSTMHSTLSAPAFHPSFGSSASKAATSVATWAGAVIFGKVTTKFGGSAPPSPVRKTSSVRSALPASSPLSDLMRMPTNGLSVPFFSPISVRSRPSSPSASRLSSQRSSILRMSDAAAGIGIADPAIADEPASTGATATRARTSRRARSTRGSASTAS